MAQLLDIETFIVEERIAAEVVVTTTLPIPADHDYISLDSRPTSTITASTGIVTTSSMTADPPGNAHAYGDNVTGGGSIGPSGDGTGSGISQSRQLVKKLNSTSVVWDYFGFTADKNGFGIDNGKPQCRSCFKEVPNKSGNTTNLFKHLKDHHPNLYSKAKVRKLLLIGHSKIA